MAKILSYRTYTRLNGKVLNLASLCADDLAFLLEAYARSKDLDTDPLLFGPWIVSSANPLLKRSIEPAKVLVDHPLLLALWDIEGRLNLALDRCSLGTSAIVDDPFADEFISVAEAANRRGARVTAIRKAGARGELVVTNDRPNMVSLRSLRNWMSDNVERAVDGRKRSASPLGVREPGQSPIQRRPARTA